MTSVRVKAVVVAVVLLVVLVVVLHLTGVINSGAHS